MIYLFRGEMYLLCIDRHADSFEVYSSDYDSCSDDSEDSYESDDSQRRIHHGLSCRR